MIAQRVPPAASRSAAPDVGGVLQVREQRRVDERVVDAEAVAAVRRVPGVGARVGAEMSEGVGPPAVREGVDPTFL